MEPQSPDALGTLEPEPEAEAFVHRVATDIPEGEWRALVWLARVREGARIAYGLLLGVGLAQVIFSVGPDALRDWRSTGTFDAAAFAVPGAVIALGLVFCALAGVAWALAEARVVSLTRRAYDGDAVRRALKEEIRLRDVRGWHDDEMRWRAERAAAPPWWRTELAGGQLIFNLEILAVIIILAVPSLRDGRWGNILVISGWAFALKFLIPAVFCAFTCLAGQPQQAFRDTWRYYRWWARSKLAWAILISPWLLGSVALFTPPAD